MEGVQAADDLRLGGVRRRDERGGGGVDAGRIEPARRDPVHHELDEAAPRLPRALEDGDELVREPVHVAPLLGREAERLEHLEGAPVGRDLHRPRGRDRRRDGAIAARAGRRGEREREPRGATEARHPRPRRAG